MLGDAASGPTVVLGGNGQDGAYLVRSLTRNGEDVVSIGLQAGPQHEMEGRPFRYRQLDLRSRDDLAQLLGELQPSRVYHFAAVHRSAAGAPYEDRFGEMLDVNVASVHVVLEQLRKHGGRLIYASSIKAFGEPLPATIDESTPRRSSCLYAVTKNAATELVHYYRERHEVEASVVYLGNHESVLRPPEFFIPKLARCLADAVTEPAGEPTAFHTLDFSCDWGSAEEYADIVVDMLERAPGEDFVLGTGRTVVARDLAEALFGERGLAVRDHLRESQTDSQVRPSYKVDVSKLERVLGRRPERTIEHVMRELVSFFEHNGSPNN